MSNIYGYNYDHPKNILPESLLEITLKDYRKLPEDFKYVMDYIQDLFCLAFVVKPEYKEMFKRIDNYISKNPHENVYITKMIFLSINLFEVMDSPTLNRTGVEYEILKILLKHNKVFLFVPHANEDITRVTNYIDNILANNEELFSTSKVFTNENVGYEGCSKDLIEKNNKITNKHFLELLNTIEIVNILK